MPDFEVLKGMAYGETIDPRHHGLIADIKAATYHILRVKQTQDGWTTEVTFDI